MRTPLWDLAWVPGTTWLAASLLLFSTACSSGSGDSDDTVGSATSRLTGELSVFLSDLTVPEAEPNDNVGSAQSLGDVTPGSVVTVVGDVSATADQNDVFEVRVPTRTGINVFASGLSNSVEVMIIDPASLQPVERYGPGSGDLQGSFVAEGNFFVSVSATAGDSGYSLRLEGTAVSARIPEQEPNDAAEDGNYLGSLQPGEALDFGGDGSNADSDYFLFAATQGVSLGFTLQSDNPSDDYDVFIYDATSSLTSLPAPVGFDEPGSTETGTVTFSGMVLFAFEVRPFAGASGSYTVEVTTSLSRVGDPNSLQALGEFQVSPRASVPDSFALTGGVNLLGPITTPTGELMGGDVIVQWAEGPQGRVLADPLPGTEVLAAMPYGGPELIRFAMPEGMDQVEIDRYTLAMAAGLRGRPDVLSAEPDHRMRAFALPQEVRPNDTFYNFQWHYEQIALPAAWNIETGSAAIRVAILDTGSAPAQDLTPRQIPGFDMINSPTIAGDGDGYDSDPTDVGDGQGSPNPSSFHGAHVAGTVGADTDNNFGVAGVTWAGGLMHVRVLGIGGGSSFDIAQGVLYAAGLPNASGQTAAQAVDVINMSLGGGGSNTTFQNAITSARDSGVVIVAAAGNENSSVPSFPAAYDGVVSVAAVDFERRRAPYSNFHPTVDIAAPGGDVSRDRNLDGKPDGVLSTKPDDSVNPTNFDSFSFYQGTSMASPHVAGVAALILSVDSTLTPAEVEAILANTATDLGASGRDTMFGEGLVNAFAAVQAAGGGSGAAPDLALQLNRAQLSSQATSKVIGVSNIGGGSLSITNVIATTTSGGSWLTASPTATGQAGSTDTSSIELTANTSGLAVGNYGGSVEVQSNGGNETIEVSLSIGGGGGSSSDLEVFVIAVDFDTFDTLAQDEVRTSGDLSYFLGGLPAGEYLIVAGTDANNDGFICDDGEPLCGVYPSLELSESVTVGQGQAADDLDIVLQPAIVAAQAGSTGGFRLLRPGGATAAPQTAGETTSQGVR